MSIHVFFYYLCGFVVVNGQLKGMNENPIYIEEDFSIFFSKHKKRCKQFFIFLLFVGGNQRIFSIACESFYKKFFPNKKVIKILIFGTVNKKKNERHDDFKVHGHALVVLWV